MSKPDTAEGEMGQKCKHCDKPIANEEGWRHVATGSIFCVRIRGTRGARCAEPAASLPDEIKPKGEGD